MGPPESIEENHPRKLPLTGLSRFVKIYLTGAATNPWIRIEFN